MVPICRWKTVRYSSSPIILAANKDYNYLSAVFSDCEGITLEKHIITHRIQKVKEPLINTHKSLTEISDAWVYNSVSHLSIQLKS